MTVDHYMMKQKHTIQIVKLDTKAYTITNTTTSSKYGMPNTVFCLTMQQIPYAKQQLSFFLTNMLHQKHLNPVAKILQVNSYQLT